MSFIVFLLIGGGLCVVFLAGFVMWLNMIASRQNEPVYYPPPERAKPGPKPRPTPEWVIELQEKRREEQLAIEEKLARQQEERIKKYQEEQERKLEQKRQAEIDHRQWQLTQRELIDLEFPTWFIHFAERRGVGRTYKGMSALRDWVLIIFDQCDNEYYGGFPIKRLWLHFRNSTLVPDISLQTLSSHSFFVDLSQTLVEAGLLLPNSGGPKAFKLAPDARQQLTLKK